MKHIFDSKNEKISEKAFVQTIVVSVASILFCIVALCSVTFCWFQGETGSNSNMLMSGSFDLAVSVMSENGSVPVVPHDGREGVFVCQLPSEGTYTVTLELDPSSSVKGHCIVAVGDDDPKHTAAIIGENTVNEAGSPLMSTFTFTVTVQKAETVTFEPRWGIVVEPDIAYGGAYTTTATE